MSEIPSQASRERDPAAAKRLRLEQGLTIALLFTGYAAYYFCRSDLSVAMPLLIDFLRGRGISADSATIHLGTVASLGVLAYAVGKLFLAELGDIWGGKRSFALGLGGAIAFTLLFASGGMLPLFTIAWIGNRLTQSIGWAGAVKICSKWFSYSSYGTVMGFLSLSYLIGDAAARNFMGSLISHGYGWRALFYFAAAVAGFFLLANLLFLRESSVAAGFAEPEANPLNVFAGSEQRPRGVWELLRPLLFNVGFVFVCLLSLGCTVVRETFNTWTPEYLHNFCGYDAGRAASLSAIFPLVGAASVMITGWMSDRLGITSRAAIMFAGLAATTATLISLAWIPRGEAATMIPLVLIGVVAFCLLGPYSYLAGAFALDFGGKQAGAASSGIIDGVGYLGGVLAGDSVARIAVRYEWRGVFVALAVVSALSVLAAAYLFVYQRRQQRRAVAESPA
jgi:sugar phosphate permease